MTNEERRLALAKARRKALEYAEAADRFPVVDMSGGTTTEELIQRREHVMRQANMWANVAEAMKTGGALEADGVITEPAIHDGYPLTTQ